jgi:5'-nucleotidase
LKNQGINKIIALGHSGFTVDKNIALEVEGIDLVIGGHTNTFLYTGIKYNKF